MLAGAILVVFVVERPIKLKQQARGFIMRNRISRQLLILICLSLCTLSIQAAEKPPALAEIWAMLVDLKDTANFEKTIKAHNQYRINKGDPRAWKFYTPVTGSNFGVYYIRFCCNEWKDNDSYRAWSSKSKTYDHWRKTGDKYVNKIEHYFDTLDYKSSQWPEKDPGFKYFEVTSFSPKQGMGAKIEARKAEISAAAKAMNWPYNWYWAWRMGGDTQLML